MKILEPKVELLKQRDDTVAHVARCARICYKRETGNDKALYNNLIQNHHWSMFRHETHYYMIPINNAPLWIHFYSAAIRKGANIVGIDICFDHNNIFIVINGNWCLDHKYKVEEIIDWEKTPEEFANLSKIAWNMMRYTFKVTTQISTSRELNRVSPNNIAEQSTRYVYEDGTICRPHWMSIEEANNFNNNHHAGMTTIGRNYINSCEYGFNTYKDLIEINGMSRQDARGVLPLDTATVCAYTYSVKEWRNIIDLRYYGTTGKPHPNAKIIAGMIKIELEHLGYDFR